MLQRVTSYLCRICENETDVLVHIFEPGQQNITEKIKIFVDIVFAPDDGLPEFICTDCSTRLDMCKEFHDLICNTASKLKTRREHQIKSITDNSQEDFQDSNSIIKEEYIFEDETENSTTLKDEYIAPFLVEYIDEEDETTKENIEYDKVEQGALNEENEYSSTDDISENLTTTKSSDEASSEETKNKTHQSISEYNENLDDPVVESDGTVVDSTRSVKQKRSTYDCEFCDKKFVSVRVLKWHRNIHTGDGLSCQLCPRTFPCVAHLNRHLRTHSGEKPFNCDLCPKKFSLKENLVRHRFSHECEESYTCSYCNTSFTCSTRLLSHIKKEHKTPTETEFKCPVCLKMFATKQCLRIHVTNHTGDKPFKCNYCEKAFSTSFYLARHTKSHTKEKPYKCDQCEKAFAEKYHLSRHMVEHSNSSPLSCTICQKKFANDYLLGRHSRIHDPSHTKQYHCDMCSKSFFEKRSLQFHKNTHTGEFPFKCKLCTKQFSHPSFLSRHMSVHNTTKLFQCDICLKSYSEQRYLDRHKESHNCKKFQKIKNNVELKCEQCPMIFLSKQQLKVHENFHRFGKRFECDICFKKFTYLSVLQRHLKITCNKKNGMVDEKDGTIDSIDENIQVLFENE